MKNRKCVFCQAGSRYFTNLKIICHTYQENSIQNMCEWLLFKANSSILQPYHAVNKEVSTSCLTKHTFPIFHELSVCTNQNYFKFGIELYFCCILYKWVSGLLRLYVSRSILLLILQHHRPTLVIDLKFRLGEACSHMGALLFLEYSIISLYLFPRA
jgi:hypothetical protein